MMKRTTVDVWVGIFVAMGIGALVFLSFRVANLTAMSHGATYQVQAHFRNLGGLKVHAPVKSAGVVVGRVTDIRFDDQQYNAEVTLAIESRYHFPMDTSANILTSGLLGDQYIGLVAGADIENLKNGDTLSITQSALVLEDLVGRLLYERSTTAAPQQQSSSQ